MNSRLNLFSAAMLMTLVAVPLGATVAADEHAAHHPAGDAAATPSTDATANMQKMHEQMATIRATKDPKERARLMDEHMQTMQSMMQKMRQNDGCMMMGNGMPMKTGQGQGEGGMNMMQMMMQQMQQHQEAMRGTGK